jgi:PPOX class probable F420-dependent enzyme
MSAMSQAELRGFLQAGTRTMHVATIGRNGRSHIAPVWFVLDGDDLVFTTWHASAKGKHLQRDPHLAVSIDDERPPYAFVVIEGTAKITTDPADLRRWATAIAARYMGVDKADDYGKRNGVEGELLVRVTPDKVISNKDVTSQ